MADPAPQSLTFEQRHHFLLRKLHSLTGIVPIGVFLIEHMLTNSMAFYGRYSPAGGDGKFNEAVSFISGLPYLAFLEIFGIFLPLAFHALYGIRIALTAEPNTRAYPYMDNRRYWMQRVTGYIAFVFLIVHLAKFRFAHWIFPTMADGSERVAFLESENFFETTRIGLTEWDLWGLHVPTWITMAIYVVGLWAACYHFANGIWSFCVSWGITVGEKAQKRIGAFAACVGILLFAWGCLSLYGFANPTVKKAPGGVVAEVAKESPP